MGTAWCGPACQVVWGLGERFPRLPDARSIAVDREQKTPGRNLPGAKAQEKRCDQRSCGLTIAPLAAFNFSRAAFCSS